MSLEQLERKSLQEINQSVKVPKGTSFWRTLLLFSGPGSLVAVGYMDPGNWITSVVGGAHYRYLLLSVVLLSSLIAMQLQQMAGKLGIVHRKDLAQTTATHLPKWLRYILWIVIELALMATDLAEVIGSGIALHLLFGWPLLFSILVTILDVFLLLGLMHLGSGNFYLPCGPIKTRYRWHFCWLSSSERNCRYWSSQGITSLDAGLGDNWCNRHAS